MKKSPKNIIFVVATFVAVIYFGDRLGAMALDAVIKHSKQRFSLIYGGEQTADILILGNSRAARGFPRNKIKMSDDQQVLNIAFPGMSMLVSAAMFLDYLDQNKSPDTIIVEVSSLGADQVILTKLRSFSAYSSRLRNLFKIYIPDTYFYSSLSHLFRHNNFLLPMILYHLKRDDQNMDSSGNVSDQMRALLTTREVPPLRITPENKQALLDIITAAKARDIRVIATVLPYLPLQYHRFPNYPEWKSQVAAILGPDVPLIDYADLFDSDRYFRDAVHLNNEGVDRFLSIAGEKLFPQSGQDASAR